MKKIIIGILSIISLFVVSVNIFAEETHNVDTILYSNDLSSPPAELNHQIAHNGLLTLNILGDDRAAVAFVANGQLRLNMGNPPIFQIDRDYEIFGYIRDIDKLGVLYLDEDYNPLFFETYDPGEIISEYPAVENTPPGKAFAGFLKVKGNEIGDPITTDSIYMVTYQESTPIFSYDSLPKTLGTFESGTKNIGVVNIYQQQNNLYQIHVHYQNTTYLLNVDNVPEHIFNSEKIYYFSEGDNRYFIGFYKVEDEFQETDDLSLNILNNSWIIWNLNTSEYTRTENNTVRIKVESRGTGWSHNELYAVVVIPHEIDDLLAMSIYYTYRYKYLIGGYGQWTSVDQQILLKDHKTEIELPWYYDVTRLFTWAVNSNHLTRDLWGLDQINEITFTSQQKIDYVDWFAENGAGVYSVEEIFPPNAKIYDLYLGTKNKFWSTAVQVKDFGVLAYRYQYKGVEYSNPYPKFEAPDQPEPEVPIDKILGWFQNLLDKIWGFFLKISYIGVGLVGLITTPLALKTSSAIFGKKVYKNRFIVSIIWIAALYAAWFALIR